MAMAMEEKQKSNINLANFVIKIEPSDDNEIDIKEEEPLYQNTEKCANKEGGTENVKLEIPFYFDQDQNDDNEDQLMIDPLTSEPNCKIKTELDSDPLCITPNISSADDGDHSIGVGLILKTEKEEENCDDDEEDFDYSVLKPELEIQIKEEKEEKIVEVEVEENEQSIPSTNLEYRIKLDSDINSNHIKNEIPENDIKPENLVRACSSSKSRIKDMMKISQNIYYNRNKHVAKGMVPCPFCKTSFYKIRICNHITIMHPRHVHKVKCTFCNKFFLDLNSDDLKHHQTVHSNVFNSFPCRYTRNDSCKMIFKTEEELQNHIIKVHEENPISCDICNKRVPTIRALKDHHLFEHNGKNEKRSQFCEKCGASFFDKKSLEDHAKEKNHS